MLFTLLDVDDSNGVGVDEFVDGCFRLKGAARSIDVHMLLLQVEKMITKVVHSGEIVARLEDRLGLRGEANDYVTDYGALASTR